MSVWVENSNIMAWSAEKRGSGRHC